MEFYRIHVKIYNEQNKYIGTERIFANQIVSYRTFPSRNTKTPQTALYLSNGRRLIIGMSEEEFDIKLDNALKKKENGKDVQKV